MGFKQRQVADWLGHGGTSMISHYEHARVLPPLAVALMMEIIYRVPVAFLFPDMYDELRRRIRALEEDSYSKGQRSLFQDH